VIRVIRGSPPKSSLERELRLLLDWLCVVWGFCIPPKDYDRIAASEHLDAAEFAAEVLRAEGFNPEHEPYWMRHIKHRFVEHFGSKSVSARDYADDQ
jgi:hypothetical protein